ncbi:hypothetical protein CLV35_2836 [Motilibacter peucedani]|uniref:Uncharacterized protein n=1 Tax=Motilibacter peucedani TaxID=598650 RepID=A0A420XMT8_9ACTN|nr:hypothetical protein [Motilibacter peucedani]RKS72589.1 hypothetical protein CLV35_2836 [Motilibacter peucedani]
MTTRVYLPGTAATLAVLLAERRLGPAPLAARAVTRALREAWPEGDEEELEFSAGADAAYDSLELLAADPGVPRRVVLAADVDDSTVELDPERGLSAVVVTAEVRLAAVASVHADEAPAEERVRAALAALPAAAAGDEAAERVVDAVEDDDLLWWATQEVGDLLSELGLPG